MVTTSIKENTKRCVDLLESINDERLIQICVTFLSSCIANNSDKSVSETKNVSKTQMFLDSIEKADDDFCGIVLSGQGRGVMCRGINFN